MSRTRGGVGRAMAGSAGWVRNWLAAVLLVLPASFLTGASADTKVATCASNTCDFYKDSAGRLYRSGASCAPSSCTGSLQLNGIQLSSLGDGVFDGLSRMGKLWLNDNQLTTIPEGVFSGMTSLYYMDLSRNELESLPEGVFSGLSALQTLFLNQNQLTTLPAGIFNGLSRLQELTLYDNELTSLPTTIFSGLSSDLQIVKLYGNSLSCYPDLPYGLYRGDESSVPICEVLESPTDPQPEATVQSQCPLGSYKESDSGGCIQCAKGTYRSSNSSTGCTSCPVGTYASSEGSSSCTDCPAMSACFTSGAEGYSNTESILIVMGIALVFVIVMGLIAGSLKKEARERQKRVRVAEILVPAAPSGLSYSQSEPPRPGDGAPGWGAGGSSSRGRIIVVIGEALQVMPHLSDRGAPPSELRFKVSGGGLLKGLLLDSETGCISGMVQGDGGNPLEPCTAEVTAYNSVGDCKQVVELVVARPEAPGCLSYDCELDEEERLLLITDIPLARLLPSSSFIAGAPPATFTVQPALPQGISLDAGTGCIHGTPTVSAGKTLHTVTAANQSGHCSAGVLLEVQDHRAPSLLTYKDLSHACVLVCGQAVDYGPDTDGTHLIYSINPPLPSGLTFCDKTGRVGGSPEAVAGRMEHIVTAENRKGKMVAVLSFAISVMYDKEAVKKWSEDQVQLWIQSELDFVKVENRRAFRGLDGEKLMSLASPEAEFWRGAGVDDMVKRLVAREVDDVVKLQKAAEERTVLREGERRALEQTAGAAREIGREVFSKFLEADNLKTGRPAEAASGLEARMCVGSANAEAHERFNSRRGRGVKGIQEEVADLVSSHPGDAEVREVSELLEYILHEGTSEKEYPNGTRDRGRPEGTRLEHFTCHRNAHKAGLSEAEVVSLRFYTTKAYMFMNQPLRDDARVQRREPCELPCATYHAEQGIKKLRTLNAPEMLRTASAREEAQLHPSEAEAEEKGLSADNGSVTLWRGVRNVKVTDAFKADGGTELAFMSTTTDLEVAVRYSLSGVSLLFKIVAGGFMVLGADLRWLSAFPAEAEVLYPPLTYLEPTGKTEEVTVDRDGNKIHFTVVEVKPVMG